MSPENTVPAIERHRAAIIRHDLSRPVRLALAQTVLTSADTFFDYGCGHGEDVKLLQAQGFQASGWDPHFFPQAEIKPAAVVNLGYVLNVIEDEAERRATLAQVWQLTGKVLIVAAQVRFSPLGKDHLVYQDGFLTTRHTFQKYYAQDELKAFLDNVLGVDAVPVGVGIFFIFRDPLQAEAWRAARYRRTRVALPTFHTPRPGFEHYRPLLQPLIDFVTERGRLPQAGELPTASDIQAEFRTFKQAFAVITQATGAEMWTTLTTKRTEDLLVYLALSRFARRPAFTTLPAPLQYDVKAFFGNYKQACEAADKLLFSLGQPATLRTACQQSPIGKLVGPALYVHLSALPNLSPLLRLYEGCASRAFGQLEPTTLIKFRADKPKISYLYYPEFDTDAHPALHVSMQVHLGRLDVNVRDYTTSENPPVLHRKETFVEAHYPQYELFASLTRAEEAQGLLAQPTTIGTARGWAQRLQEMGVTVQGHQLIKNEP